LIIGGMSALLIAVFYTIVTGKLRLNKTRVTYGTPARGAALLGLVPMMLLCAYSIRFGGILHLSNAIPIFLGVFLISFAVIYTVGWSFGEPPRS